MGSYQIEWKLSAAKALKNLPQQAVLRIVLSVERLSLNPYPVGVKKLVGAQHTYRIRVGDYRVIYTVWEAVLVIEILRVAHRREAYRG